MNTSSKDWFITFLSLVFIFFFILLVSTPFNKRDIVNGEDGREVVSVPIPTKTVEPKTTTLIFTGDVMLGRTVMNKSMEFEDAVYPFRKVAEKLKSADIVFVNLESIIIENCPFHDSGLKLCAKPEMVEGLVFSGVDIVSLANNHAHDFGKQGLLETAKILEGEGILSTGLGEVEIIEKDGVKFGFLGFNFTFSTPDSSDFELVERSAKKVDLLVIGVHWGEEYTGKAKDYQKKWARQLVEGGAAIVVGHHPHWVQDVEYVASGPAGLQRENVPIYYSLGNFIFDQMWSEETKKGMVVELTFKEGELIDEVFHNTYMNNWAQPEFVD